MASKTKNGVCLLCPGVIIILENERVTNIVRPSCFYVGLLLVNSANTAVMLGWFMHTLRSHKEGEYSSGIKLMYQCIILSHIFITKNSIQKNCA